MYKKQYLYQQMLNYKQKPLSLHFLLCISYLVSQSLAVTVGNDPNSQSFFQNFLPIISSGIQNPKALKCMIPGAALLVLLIVVLLILIVRKEFCKFQKYIFIGFIVLDPLIKTGLYFLIKANDDQNGNQNSLFVFYFLALSIILEYFVLNGVWLVYYVLCPRIKNENAQQNQSEGKSIYSFIFLVVLNYKMYCLTFFDLEISQKYKKYKKAEVNSFHRVHSMLQICLIIVSVLCLLLAYDNVPIISTFCAYQVIVIIFLMMAAKIVNKTKEGQKQGQDQQDPGKDKTKNSTKSWKQTDFEGLDIQDRKLETSSKSKIGNNSKISATQSRNRFNTQYVREEGDDQAIYARGKQSSNKQSIRDAGQASYLRTNYPQESGRSLRN